MEEVRSIFARIPGVEDLCAEGEGADTRLIVMHDPGRVTTAQLLEILGRLPSFSEASFGPTSLGRLSSPSIPARGCGAHALTWNPPLLRKAEGWISLSSPLCRIHLLSRQEHPRQDPFGSKTQGKPV